MSYLAFGIVFLAASILWGRFIFNVLDERLRKRLGARFGVTLRLGTGGHWKVQEPGQGLRGCLIELLQVVFLAPALLLPPAGALVVFLLLFGP